MVAEQERLAAGDSGRSQVRAALAPKRGAFPDYTYGALMALEGGSSARATGVVDEVKKIVGFWRP